MVGALSVIAACGGDSPATRTNGPIELGLGGSLAFSEPIPRASGPILEV